MTEPLIIHLETHGDGLKFSKRPLNQTAASVHLGYAKMPPEIDPTLAEELRKGNLSPEVFFQMQKRLMAWAAEGLAPLLEAEIDKISADPDAVLPVVFYDRDLPAEIADRLKVLPLELLIPGSGRQALAVNTQVALTYYTGRISEIGARLGNGTQVLRVLLVRSSPNSLDDVPPALELRTEMLEMAQSFGFEIEVDVLSSEAAGPDIAGPPTIKNLKQQVGKGYDILLYVGHGDRDGRYRQGPTAFCLKLEDSRKNQYPVYADKLVPIFLRSEIPIVLLVGCWTALASSHHAPVRQARAAPPSQGLAHALIDNPYTPLRAAVGMRTRIDTEQAKTFILEFFASLLGEKLRGNIQQAVCAARRALEDLETNEFGWIAPVFFSTLPSEPFLRFREVPRAVLAAQEARLAAWSSSAAILATESGDLWDAYKSLLLTQFDDQFFSAMPPNIAVLQLGLGEGTPGQEVDIALGLRPGPSVSHMKATLSLNNVNASILGVTSIDAGMVVTPNQSAAPSQKFTFTLSSDSEGSLPTGPTLKAKLRIADIPPRTSTIISAEIVEIEPPVSPYPSSNILIVV